MLTRRLSRSLASLALVSTAVLGGASAASAGHPDDVALRPGTTGGSIAPGAPASMGARAGFVRRVVVGSSEGLQQALDSALPGDRIVLGPGVYTGPFVITTSGTASNPIVLAPQVGALVMLKSLHLTRPVCGAGGPSEMRTIRFDGGASHWVVQGLDIDGGIMISAPGATQSNIWFTQQWKRHDWQSRRAVPGQGSDDPAAADGAAAYLSGVIGTTIVPSDDIQILGNHITTKGVFSRFGRYGVIADNTITDIGCGTGDGIWLTNFSSGWTVTRNDVSNVAASTYAHYMMEGIRLGSGASYNVVSNNTVHDLSEKGRAFTNDIDGSWNVFTHNTATNVDIGFNEQQAGWGNTWSYNTADVTRTAAFSFRMQDLGLKTPSYDTSTNLAVVRCNVALASPVGMQAGAMMASQFQGNSFGTVSLGANLRGYWTSVGDTWDGGTTPPSPTPTANPQGC